MTSTKLRSDFTPCLKGVHLPVATDLSEKRGGASEQPANVVPHIILAASLERIANGKTTAENFGERWLSCMNVLVCWKKHFEARWRSVTAIDGQRRIV